MAYVKVEGRYLYFGLNADTRPTDAVYDAKYYATDTKHWEIYTNAGWVLYNDFGSGDTAPGAGGLTSVTADSAANTALTQTVAAVAGKSHYLYAFGASVGAAALASTVTVTIKDGATAIYKVTLGVGSPIGEARYREFAKPIKITTAAALTLEATAGGAGVVMTGNLVYETK